MSDVIYIKYLQLIKEMISYLYKENSTYKDYYLQNHKSPYY